jgi:hypothetical protein
MKFTRVALSKLLDVYSSEAALIDENGTILAVNRAWRQFEYRNGLGDPGSSERTNYLKACERAKTRGARGAETVCAGIRSVLSGASESFSCTYNFHSTITNQWFRLTASSFSLSKDRRWAVILHINITHQRILAARFLRLSRRKAEFVSVCAWCRLIQMDPDRWISFEEYFANTRGIRFSHGICPECVASFSLGASTCDTAAGAGSACKHRR